MYRHNTIRNDAQFYYQNAGSMHIGSSNAMWEKEEHAVYCHLKRAGIAVSLETGGWKKWMLNVAGNNIIVLTGADYNSELQQLCIRALQEFLTVAAVEHVRLDE